jgi:hypothetical protein
MTIQSAMKGLMKEAKEARERNAIITEADLSISKPRQSGPVEPKQEAAPVDRSTQLKVGNILLEYEAKRLREEEFTSELPTENNRGGQRKHTEEKVKPIRLSLSPKYFNRFINTVRPVKYKHCKKFGNARKLMSILDKIEELEKREKRRSDALRSLLREFYKIKGQYESSFKRSENSQYVQHFLDEFKKKYKTINYIYHALSITRNDIDEYLTKDESDALSFAIYMNQKEESGELIL